jgi:hypothetical protein
MPLAGLRRGLAGECTVTVRPQKSSIIHMTALPGQTSTFTRSQSLTLDHQLDAVIETALVLNRIVGAVMIVAHRGEIVYESAAGFAERETRTLMRPDTIDVGARASGSTGGLSMTLGGLFLNDRDRAEAGRPPAKITPPAPLVNRFRLLHCGLTGT